MATGWDLFDKLLRSLSFFFDRLIYGFIAKVYNFIEVLAKISLFGDNQLSSATNNIYAIIGIFVLFRLAIILLKSIVDPDLLTSKEGGAAKMLSKVIIALILIVAIPWGFNFAFRLQNTVLDNQILSKVILGSGGTEQYRNAGQNIARTTLEAFLSCNEAAENCNERTLEGYFERAFPREQGSEPDFAGLTANINLQSIRVGRGTNQTSDEVFRYTYFPLLSTICGGFVLYIMVVIAFEVASRIIKLAFLQLMSPIAVIGYVDPKGTVFSSWLKMTIETYINLFIRLFAIYFVVYMTHLITNLNLNNIRGYDGEILDLGGQALLVKIFIVLGALMFAKEAPKMLAQMLNLSEGSVGGLLKSPFKSMVGGGLVGGALGLAGGAAMKGTAALAGGVSGLASSSSRGGSKWAGFKQGASESAKGVSWKASLKGVGGMTTAWHKGATAGASGALGTDTTVGVSRIMENARKRTEDQQTRARIASQLKRAKDLAKGKEENIANNRNPYAGLYGKADYENQAWNVDRAKQFLKESELTRQNAYNAFAMDQTDANKDAYYKANEAYVGAQKTLDSHKGELERLDTMGTYATATTERKILEAYEAQQKADKTLNPQAEQNEAQQKADKTLNPQAEQNKK